MGNTATKNTKLTKYKLYFEEYKAKIEPSKWLRHKMAVDISRELRRNRRARRALKLRQIYFKTAHNVLNFVAVTL